MAKPLKKNADNLVIAVSKGRILSDAIPLLGRIGIEVKDDPDTSRKLVLETSNPGFQLLVIRASDVPTYVEYGAADLGIAGKDVLLEYEGADYYEPVDLRLARCRLVVAGLPNTELTSKRPRIATK